MAMLVEDILFVLVHVKELYSEAECRMLAMTLLVEDIPFVLVHVKELCI